MSNSKHPSIRLTGDGSPTVQLPDSEVTYHSIHGALTEAKHVYIEQGIDSLDVPKNRAIHVLEVGFGTGLNAALAMLWARDHDRTVHYRGLEPYPLLASFWDDYPWAKWPFDVSTCMKRLHAVDVNTTETFFEKSTFRLENKGVEDDLNSEDLYDVVFYDAFAPSYQPELWNRQLFRKLRESVRPGGILVTYCAKGFVRRNLMAAGWDVLAIPGSPGKKEMLRGVNHPVSRFNVRVYGVILDAAGDRILVCNERLSDGSHAQKFPGGGVELGEGILDAWWREVQEELGCRPVMQSAELFHSAEPFVRSAFRKEEQVIALYYLFQMHSDEGNIWTEEPANSPGGELGVKVSWKCWKSLDYRTFRFLTDQTAVQKLQKFDGRISQ
ncbi:MAG: tRNA (5-methylaminomethyl-2-thiouridine)(34)-methyltransferase MnmD [Flavobacteriales bacterium]|nr:tRNA (5-methylaminomethyl-2-thiouridine)(34)-methyltransferase MnmD [Flavobacteriales bacterium]